MPSSRPRSRGSASVCSSVVIEVFIARKAKLMPTSATRVTGSTAEWATTKRLTAYTAPPTISSRRLPADAADGVQQPEDGGAPVQLGSGQDWQVRHVRHPKERERGADDDDAAHQ